jgi:hypothetical protein
MALYQWIHAGMSHIRIRRQMFEYTPAIASSAMMPNPP